VSDIVVVLLIVLVGVLLIRGPKMLPKLGEAFGRGVKETKRELNQGLGPETDEPGATDRSSQA
jgi:Sec-independent protein translocase protein TatA